MLLPPQGNRLTLSVGGMPLEVVLPDTLASAAKTNPALLARGTVLQVEIDPQTGVLRLSLPTIGMPADRRPCGTSARMAAAHRLPLPRPCLIISRPVRPVR